MKATKKVIANLNKCYATTKVTIDGTEYLLSAAEKNDPCYMFTLDGEKVDTIWETDGGIMTMEQIPGTNDFLSTNRFFSPNDCAKARIVRVSKETGEWKRTNVLDALGVHRFGILQRGGVNYLIVCTLKSALAFKNDWTCPGRVWVGELPEDLENYNDEKQIPMTALISGLYKNHGFAKVTEDGMTYALVGTENGIFKVVPPAEKGGEWEYECMIEGPASDMLYFDFDGDGEKEMLVMTPFHGDTINYYKMKDGKWEMIQTWDEKLPFLHAVWGAVINGKPYGFIGNRQGDMKLYAFYWDNEQGKLVADVLDDGVGPANCMHFVKDGKDYLISNNRETDEVALYELEP